jgi:hypothetical protein
MSDRKEGRVATAREIVGDYPDFRSMAEDGDLAAAVRAWYDLNLCHGGITDVLLLRACDRLGIMPPDINATELIEEWKA